MRSGVVFILFHARAQASEPEPHGGTNAAAKDDRETKNGREPLEGKEVQSSANECFDLIGHSGVFGFHFVISAAFPLRLL